MDRVGVRNTNTSGGSEQVEGTPSRSGRGDPLQVRAGRGDPLQGQSRSRGPPPGQVQGTPSRSEQVQGTPSRSEQVEGTPSRSEQVEGTPSRSKQVEGTPSRSKQVEGTPSRSEQVEGTPSRSGRGDPLQVRAGRGDPLQVRSRGPPPGQVEGTPSRSEQVEGTPSRRQKRSKVTSAQSVQQHQTELEMNQEELADTLWGEELQRIRSEFVKGVSEPVIKGLLDDLWQQKVFSTEEMDSVMEERTKADQARCLIDMVMGNGERASQAMIDSMKKRDQHLCSTLGLMSSPAGVDGLGVGTACINSHSKQR
ncbi:unnamed protein product [Boreogadus saida]